MERLVGGGFPCRARVVREMARSGRRVTKETGKGHDEFLWRNWYPHGPWYHSDGSGPHLAQEEEQCTQYSLHLSWGGSLTDNQRPGNGDGSF